MTGSANTISSMFNRIAHRYDFLNRFLSFGLDMGWRKKVAQFFPRCENIRALDLATGTGDLAFAILKRCPNVVDFHGVDIASNMLELGNVKALKAGLDSCVHFEVGDACQLRFADASFDVVTMAFGIRNVSDVDKALSEIKRVLRPGGRVLILEFSLPRFFLFRSLYLFYFRHLLPLLGGWLSGDRSAYRYLNQSVEVFPSGQAFVDRLGVCGFKQAIVYPLSFGISSIYVADKDPV